MKIGDKFISGGNKYVVIGENESGFISTIVTEEVEEVVETATPKRGRKAKEEV